MKYNNTINKILLIITLIISQFAIAQKEYKIDTTTWHYTIPNDYVSKIDNFEKERQAGEAYLKKEENITFSSDDVVLLSIEKQDSTANIVFVNYKNNLTIQKYTLSGYAENLKEMLIKHSNSEYPNAINLVTIEDIYIDKIKFKVIKQSSFLKKIIIPVPSAFM